VARASPAIAAFNAGEFSPQMEGRVDTEKYPIAAHIQQNFIPLKQGPSTFRPGTAYVQPVKNSAQRSWLVRFEFSFTQAFILEFGGGYVRFYTNHGPLLATGTAAYNGATAYVPGNLVTSGGLTYLCILATTGNAPPNATYWYPLVNYTGLPAGSAIYEIPSPYASADLTNAAGFFNLDIRQQGDVLYIMGGSAGAGPSGVGYPPYTLTRFSNNPPNWQFAQYAPVDGPFSPALPIVQNQNIALGVSATSGNGITITSYGGNVFAATDVGRLVRIATQYFSVTPWATQTAFAANATCSNNGNNYVALNSATTGGSPPVHTAGSALDGPAGVRWLYTDSNYGIAKITGYTSPTQVTANVLLNFPASVVAVAETITGITQAVQAVVATTAGTVVVGASVFIFGVLGMTQINGNVYSCSASAAGSTTLAGQYANSANYTAYASGGTLVAGGTLQWQLGAWSNTTEWPRAVALFKDRLFLAGKLYIWGSVPGLYTSHAQDFNGQQTTDSAINIIVQGLDASNITWLSDNIILIIGTEGGEYGLDAANSSAPLGPANVECLPQSQWRCRDVHPAKIGTSLLYLQRAGRKVLAADYNFYLNRYDSTDQNKFSYHITIGSVIGMTYQAEPWSLLWAWRADGTFLSYTFNREDNVTAWVRHNMGNGGQVESMAIIPSPDGVRDEFWAIVNRTVNGAVIRTVEYSVKHFEGPQAGYVGDAQSSAWYVDCGVQTLAGGSSGPPTFQITNVQCAFSLKGGPVTTYTCNQSFIAGQLVFVSGINYTGTFNPNVQGAIITNANGSSFTIAQGPSPINGGTFAYLSGGSASVGSAGNPNPLNQTISGLPPVMWNQTVSVFADGGVQPQQVVSATGSITLAQTFNVVTIGFPYQGNLVPMRPEGGADVGTAQGKLKQGAGLVIRVVDAAGGTISKLSNINPTTQTYQDPLGLTTLTPQYTEAIAYNQTTTPLDSPPPFQSGDFPVSFPAADSSDQDQRDFYILVQQNSPTPMTVAGLFPSYKVEEPQ
jgi:hypothetical protein